MHSTLATQVILIPTARGFATCGELKLPFVTRGKIYGCTIPTIPPEGIAAFPLPV